MILKSRKHHFSQFLADIVTTIKVYWTYCLLAWNCMQFSLQILRQNIVLCFGLVSA